MESVFYVGISADFQLEAAGIIEPFLAEYFDPYPAIHYDFFQCKADAVVQPQHIADYDALLTLRPRFNAQSFVGIDRLAVIARWGVGYDVIDVPACTRAHVLLTITTGAVNRPVAEAILTFMLALAKKLPQKDRLTREGRWDQKGETSGLGLRGKVIGSLGLGNIAGDMFHLLEPFELGRQLAYDPFVDANRAAQIGVELVDLTTLFSQSDFLAINCPLNDQTRGMVNANLLSLMKPTAYLINTARGGIVNQADLVEILRQHRIAGAGLDVFEQEPLPADHPLTALDNVILSPHGIAWTDEIYHANSESACRSILSILRGDVPEDRFLVNKDVVQQLAFRDKLNHLRRRWNGD
jgi:phosphoglycerate dehydrogenase-like enzyme